MEGDLGLSSEEAVSIEPRVNIGSQFQAELPELRDRSQANADNHGATLVWKPWGDIETNPETQDTVTQLLNVACSSVMPGGGTSQERALHCLHQAQGNVMDALAMLLFGMPQESESHPLADYHYTGSDSWSPLEEQLFREAFLQHKKDFNRIQKKVQTKTVAQCVEYYYTWKKKVKFGRRQPQGSRTTIKRTRDEAENPGEEAGCNREKRRRLPSKGRKGRKAKSVPKVLCSADIPSISPSAAPVPAGIPPQQDIIPCEERERVSDNIKEEEANMGKHFHLPEELQPLLKIKLPPEVAEISKFYE